MGLQKRTRVNYIDEFFIPYRTHVTEKVPVPGINFSLLRNISDIKDNPGFPTLTQLITTGLVSKLEIL